MAEPIQPTPSAAETEVIRTEVVVDAPAPRKRRRWPIVLVSLIVLAALLVVGFIVADRYAKQYATDYVRERIVEVLKLDDGADVQVDIGTGSVLLQAARGALDDVTVSVDDVTFGEITGSAQITAAHVPLDSSQPVTDLGIVVTVPEASVQKLAGFMSGIDLTSITLQDELIRISTEFTVLFLSLPISVDLEPAAKDGGIAFDPVTVLLGDREISVADLRANPQFQAIAGELLASREFCVAGYLPQALTVDDVDVVGSTLVLSINGDGTALSDPALSELGTCPA